MAPYSFQNVSVWSIFQDVPGWRLIHRVGPNFVLANLKTLSGISIQTASIMRAVHSENLLQFCVHAVVSCVCSDEPCYYRSRFILKKPKKGLRSQKTGPSDRTRYARRVLQNMHTNGDMPHEPLITWALCIRLAVCAFDARE